ncbi:putative ubiquinol-cytochrome-c reductase cytochrome c1 protein [Botrytis fragariae]|uniref:Putative ubiquinol-cytochrome-c reductase cytochrome c1 protein n=1 Tax=Botrytis fragariae TaxID=1964551 RepID=A0A8H6AIK3_9HELO|nr:putative ubiquinol-cytochrome-c reductase cytochrome c1 protein [Botrytis fragariae]KAF5868282.1 putative ubiquinol-cytochrome-c reductase cytochrome c1 protein [Botrytis fragariae]
MDTIMKDTIMKDTNDAAKQRFRHTSILNEAVAAPKTAITFTQIVEISSDDGSSEESSNGGNDRESVDKQQINNAKQSDEKQHGKADDLTPVEGFADKRAIRSYPRVQGGKISKTTKDGTTVQKVVLCRPDSSVVPTRPDQLHLPKPQCKDAKSGRGQIPGYYGSRGLKRAHYSDKSLRSEVRPRFKDNPHGHYSQRKSNLPYLPFILQITILRSLQTALESMCYRFVQKWLPNMLNANTWECPENVELNLWWGAMNECQIPVEAIGRQARFSLNSLFLRVSGIRHLAVHRLTQVAIDSIKAMIEDALEIAHIFRDDIFVPEFELWKEKLDYCLEVDRKASGMPIMVRRLDAIKTMREDNASCQDKLQKEIFALRAELLEKEQKVARLHGEYIALGVSETDTIELAHNGGKLSDEEVKHLGDFKSLEECFTLNFDRNAPNPEPAENFSGNLIMLSRVGSPPRPGSGGGPMANWGTRLDKNARLMRGNSRVDTNGPINSQSSIHKPTVSHGTGINALLLRPEPIARNAYGTPMNITDNPGSDERTASGSVSKSHTEQPNPATAVVVDLTEDDDDVMVE